MTTTNNEARPVIHPEPFEVLLTINPEIASKFLERFPVNRRYEPNRAARYARDMAEGRWNERLRDPIHVDKYGETINGKHRLEAVRMSGVSIKFRVIYGLEPDDILMMDQGRPRSVSDQLKIMGKQYFRIIAASIPVLYAWEQIQRLDPSGIHPSKQLTNAEKLEFFRQHLGLELAAARSERLRHRLGLGSGRWGAIFYILNEVDPEDADTFFTLLETGENLGNRSAIYHLRRRLLDNMGPSAKKTSPYVLCALVLKAWNLWRENRPVEVLSWRMSGTHPDSFPKPI